MLRDFVLESVSAPGSGATITLPGSSPAGRLTWAARFVTSQPVFYVLDDSIQSEWGVGALTVGAPSTIARPTVVLGNSAGTTARLNFTGTTRCYNGFPAGVFLAAWDASVGRNLFHNGLDRIQQRGAGAFTGTTSYLSDRWLINAVNGTRSVTVSSLADADRTAIGDETAEYGLAYVFSGTSGAGDFELLIQRLEGVRRTAGKTVTVSFWAKAASGTPSVGLNFSQVFGTGGSPSTTVNGTAQTVTLSTTWTRYQLTFAIPSASGKTFGSTVGTDYLEWQFWLSSGATFNTRAGSIGVQAATVTFFGRQLEIGPAASPLEKPGLVQDRANCQRFYYAGRADMQGAAYVIAATTFAKADFPVTMRATPTVATAAGGSTTNVSGAAVGALGTQGAFCSGTATAAGNWSIAQNFTATADL